MILLKVVGPVGFCKGPTLDPQVAEGANLRSIFTYWNARLLALNSQNPSNKLHHGERRWRNSQKVA